VAVQYVWKHPDRKEVQLQLYGQLRIAHVGGWVHLVVCCELLGRTWVGVELATTATERDARDWYGLLPPRYLVKLTIDELLAEPRRFAELYLDGGVRAFLNEREADDRMRELGRQLERIWKWRET